MLELAAEQSATVLESLLLLLLLPGNAAIEVTQSWLLMNTNKIVQEMTLRQKLTPLYLIKNQ